MKETEFAIETSNLTKIFGGYVAVNGMTVQVKKGEIFGFLGPNGAGKTTAIRMLCGLLVPTKGSGQVAGFDIVRQSARIRSRIGYMSQRFALYGDLRVCDNLRLFAGLYGLSGRRMHDRMMTVAPLVGISGLLESVTSELPWGWQQRVALACAVIHEPQVLFLDEPTGSVDPVSRRLFWDIIHAFSARGMTVFVTTHHMDEAENCHRVSIMSAGRIIAVDTPSEIKRSTGTDTLEKAFVSLVTASACL